MSSLKSGKRQIAISTMRTVRELALSADLAARAGEQDRCMAIVARIYDLFDDSEEGLAADPKSRVLAADAAFWVGDRDRAAVLIAEAQHPRSNPIRLRTMGRRVLFAEDDAAVRSVVGELLREEGFDVVEAENGDEAAFVLETQDFDFLLTDVRMPGSRDGLDLAAYARRKDPNLAVVVVTGYADQVGIRIGSLGKHVTLLSKPFQLLDLVTALGGPCGAAQPA